MIKLLQLFSLILCPSQLGSYFYLVKIKPTLVSTQPSIYRKAPQTDSLFSPHTATPLLEVLLNSLLCLQTWTNHSLAPHNSDSQPTQVRLPMTNEYATRGAQTNDDVSTQERETWRHRTGRVGGVCQKWRNKKKSDKELSKCSCFVAWGGGGVPSSGWFGNWKASNEASTWGWCERSVTAGCGWSSEVVSSWDWACRFLTLRSDWG